MRPKDETGGGALAAAFPVASRLPQAGEEARGALAVDRQTIARSCAHSCSMSATDQAPSSSSVSVQRPPFTGRLYTSR